MDDNETDPALPHWYDGPAGWWRGLPPPLRAVGVFCLPFVIVDAFNYYSAGAAQALSLPILLLLYAGCGALAAHLGRGRPGSDLRHGATAGLVLWLVSFIVNGLIALLAGVATLGTTLLLGVPYLCLCGPVHLVAGGLCGLFGAWLYGLFIPKPPPADWWAP